MIEISYELVCLFQISEVITSWEKTFDLVFNLTEIINPEVSAKTRFGDAFTVVWEVVVDLI